VTGDVIIVGASVGGVEAAASLRSAGFDGRITLAGAEAHLPYDKPPLSKGLLTGRVQAREIGLRSEEWYQANDVRLLLGCRATGLDAASGRVLLANGHQVPAGIVVLATGAAPVLLRAMRVPGVHILRTLGDGLALATALAGAESTVVVGAGFIGAEVAASARASGREVTLVDADSLPFGRTVGAEVAGALLNLHAKAGIRIRYGTPVRAATAHQVELADGEILRADMVVAGLGVQRVTGWLADSPVALSNGISCDAAGQTSAPACTQSATLRPGSTPSLGSMSGMSNGPAPGSRPWRSRGASRELGRQPRCHPLTSGRTGTGRGSRC
jgi:3-phenylpropionate/trans-cinnamate dioxygenase ferredoxin reductase subunit